MRLGIHPHEAEPQRVRLSVWMTVAYPVVPDSDTIDAVLDYDFLRDGIRAMAAGPGFALQEPVPRRSARAIGARPLAQARRLSRCGGRLRDRPLALAAGAVMKAGGDLDVPTDRHAEAGEGSNAAPAAGRQCRPSSTPACRAASCTRDIFWSARYRPAVSRARGRSAPARQARLAALSTARTLAVAMSLSIPTPKTVRPSAVRHST